MENVFEPEGVSTDGVGHRFRRGDVAIDTTATITMADTQTGSVPIPDWLGAVLLKARAVTAVPDQRDKHAQDLALLLSLPVDLHAWVNELAGQDRQHLKRARAFLDERAWRSVASAVDTRIGLAALELLA